MIAPFPGARYVDIMFPLGSIAVLRLLRLLKVSTKCSFSKLNSFRLKNGM
jgi:hypothetical protein